MKSFNSLTLSSSLLHLCLACHGSVSQSLVRSLPHNSFHPSQTTAIVAPYSFSSWATKIYAPVCTYKKKGNKNMERTLT